ncbi:hypothetical protein MKK58_09440 [Methylobacterium sp. J-078]|uniref:hypothetical protein n=1 Tax=Methylobacterium sp. J-078 TaxID=2836657 RepID=UPI001FBB63DA|nr:hypothetical protein [Methylobacterium sp. J-078]MCJ2044749.1 hypothetical protein [Methylobacterium sp. J-078]
MPEKDVARAVRRALAILDASQVLVGIPAEAGEHEGGISNAALGYILDTGDLETNLPPRPWLVPGVEAVRDQITKQLATGARKVIDAAIASDGDVRAARAEAAKALERVGLIAQGSIQRRISEGIAPALSERTVYARLHRRKNRRSAGKMTPLIDTGQFIRSITYVVKISNGYVKHDVRSRYVR